MALLAVALLLAVAPPTIHERFTPLPCPMRPATTLGLEGCEEHAVLAGDRAIDAQARAVFALLPASGRAAFVRGEGSWLRYRNLTCAAAASRDAGGTLAPVAAATCMAARDGSHLKELQALRRSLKSP